MSDATFEDGAEAPLRLQALDTGDLEVLSSLVQDAVLPASEIKFLKKHRRLALLINRFRWEDVPAAERRGRKFERVQSVLSIENAQRVLSQGIDQSDSDLILSILSLGFEAGEDGTGRISLTLAGDGVIAADVEALDVTLSDVTRPYLAPSGHRPDHE